MIGHSIARTTVFNTMAGTSVINPKGARHKKSIFSDLLLTALIDAFSILVIFLLMSFSSSGEILYMNKDMELPKAGTADKLARNTVLKMESGKIFIEDVEVPKENLVAALMGVRQKFNETHPGEEFPGQLTLQADRRAKYDEINSVVLATGNAGFSEIKFAVIMR